MKRHTALFAVPLLAATACAPRDTPAPEPGVALALADYRAEAVSDLRYDVSMNVPESDTDAVTGTVTVRFTLADVSQPLTLDFRAPPENVRDVRLNGDSVAYTVPPDHIVIPASALSPGAQAVTVQFKSTNAALNRQEEFLYALFVPDRASTALPVFEQPNLKARYTLTLTVPAEWEAVANGAMISRDSSDALRHVVQFAETQPISTYLFSFAAGRMQVERAERHGRAFTMYHRETDAEKVARNREAIFDLHATAIAWLEEYTGIPYPFDKFDFFAVPSFQFGGMEHPGAIWYRSSSLFLDPTASRTQMLGRASLIAHETAHMWFGDLVTMRWFNDVWMKEVFANFMAAKIAEPAFPDLNLKLRFFQAHFPSAYSVDRTAGANPIRQPLDNLRDAGSLYGAIIYQKAPVVMQQLETLVGPDVFRDGLRTYLDRYRYGNATWPELIAILDALSDEDLTTWSRAWVEEPGRPRLTARWADSGVVVTQRDDNASRNLRWNQPIVLALGVGDTVQLHSVQLRDAQAFVAVSAAEPPEFILPGADGMGYGRFVLDAQSRRALLARTPLLTDPIVRAVAWQSLWEEVLDDSLDSRAFLDQAIAAIATEQDELIAPQLLGLARSAYWQFLTPSERLGIAPRFEQTLWQALDAAPTAGQKGTYFGALTSVTLTPSGIDRLERIWRKAETPRGLPLAEQQYISLAEELAIREVPNSEAILDAQAARISNPDRLARFNFMRPALSVNVATRDSLFRTFSDVDNRRRESWVLGAQRAMHHPLRAQQSIASVRASLDLVEEIQATGDIFFPLSWLNATLGGHQSSEAAAAVREFLADNPNLPPRLRGKVLQAADDLYRLSARRDR